MLKVEGLLGLLVLALWIYSIIDVAGSRESEVRALPKIAWVFIVLIFPFVGSVAWLIAGRPDPRQRGATAGGPGSPFPEYDRPGRMRATSPDDDEAFLRQVRERAEEQRRRHRQEQQPPPPTDTPPDASAAGDDPPDEPAS